MARMKFMNTEVDNLTMEEALHEIDKLIKQNKNAYVVTPNVDHIIQLERGGELCEVYKNGYYHSHSNLSISSSVSSSPICTSMI